jgi:transcriptional regulator with XRE-family HTH domain
MKKRQHKFDTERDKTRMALKNFRKQYRRTQQQVADFLGMTRANYGGCENGNFRISTEVILGIVIFYKDLGANDISFDDFLFPISR